MMTTENEIQGKMEDELQGKMENSCDPSVGQGPESSLPLPGRRQVWLFSPAGAKAKLRAPMKGMS